MSPAISDQWLPLSDPRSPFHRFHGDGAPKTWPIPIRIFISTAFKVATQNKRAAQYGSDRGSFTLDEWFQRCDYFGWRCAYCLKQLNAYQHYETSALIEHIDPLSRGGGNTIDNIVPACKSCDTLKNNKKLLEWLLQPGGYWRPRKFMALARTRR